ncbi:preprotein translocase subunit YajC [Propionispira arboris]|jgi:preprotein translocase subunit YajC|uniref:Preprotein translocase subunit YajC n=1 Tax=Propionispira arboris TaxID=84035 RepID=A0A1H6WFA5_9FIRM|nr:MULTISPECIES: preprotein translocase subunit YajC [Propionispira]SEJ12767.1 preprotein translocase subunit YajC [Propionispira arboris]
MDPEMMGMLASYGPIVIMVIIFYFLLYKPQKKEQKRRKEMLDNINKGNRIMTVGGIYGEITSIKDNIVTVKIADKVEIEVARSSINANVSQEKK